MTEHRNLENGWTLSLDRQGPTCAVRIFRGREIHLATPVAELHGHMGDDPYVREAFLDFCEAATSDARGNAGPSYDLAASDKALARGLTQSVDAP